MAEEYAPAPFRPLPSPENRRGVVKPFQRHRIISNDQFGQVVIPEPQRRTIAEQGEAWQGQTKEQ